MKWIYNQVILPSSLYGYLIWYHTLDYRLYTKHKFENLQRHAALSITRGLNSTSSANLDMLAGLRLINLKKELAILAALRLKLNNRWDDSYIPDTRPSYISHASSADKLGSLSDWIPRRTSLDRNFRISIKPRDEIVDFIANLNPPSWLLYTDGSKQGPLTRVGYCVLRHSHRLVRNSYSLGSTPTAF